MQGDKWIIEIFNHATRKWCEEGTPEEDFGKLWRESEDLARRGYKARVVKIGQRVVLNVPKYPETPEQKLQEGEKRQDGITCTFSIPYGCEYCHERTCPVSAEEFKEAMKKLEEEKKQ